MSKRRSRPAAAALRSMATAMKAGEALGAAAGVIAARTEMTALAAANPSAEAAAELGLMVTEKLTAFSQSGAVVAAGAADLAGRSARYAASEAGRAGEAFAQLAACRTPSELLQAQARLATGFWTRGLAYGLGLNAALARTGERALEPVHRTVTANHKRLKK